jgi:hypothetical protein
MRTAILTTLALGAVLTAAAPALADPTTELLPMTCSDATTVSISPAPANGTFTPNFDSRSTAVFLPLSIQLSRTLRDSSGAIVGAEQAPAAVLGNGRQLERRPTVTCSAGETLTSEQDPEIPPGDTLNLAITIIGSWTPRH